MPVQHADRQRRRAARRGAAFLLFGPVAGALADRRDRKTMMIWCEAGRGLLATSVAVALELRMLTLPQLYLVAVASGILTTIFQTANTAALPNVVAPAHVPTALGYTQSAFSAVRIFGASLAGLVHSLGAVGAVLGSLTADRITRRYPLGRIAVLMLWVEASAFPLYALAPSPSCWALSPQPSHWSRPSTQSP